MMARPDVFEVVAAALRIEPHQLTDETSFQSIPEWDSLGHVGLMEALEEAFGITVSDDVSVELTSIDAIRRFVAALPFVDGAEGNI